MILGPVIAYWVTKRICLGLQRKDAHLLAHGVETGIIRQLPSGEFVELTRPVPEQDRAALEYNRVNAPELPRATPDGADAVPAPETRSMVGRVRGTLNRVITEGIPVAADGHGNGHGNGHGAPAAVPGGAHPALEQGGADGADGEGHPPSH